ncbi:MAG TPA: S8 family serine peptidase [Acidimicrobiia bacterium]|nr:S8 family serine peptidase [Acidimicrobiia bacterium]
MRIATTLLAVLSLFALPAVRGEADSPDTVSLLVPADAPIDSLKTQSATDSRVGWKRVVVPVQGTVDQTRSAWAKQLGATVAVERAYPLLVGQDEPDFDRQWGLENTGQAGGTPNADIDAIRAWSKATGKGVVVAVIDSGVDADHPDLTGQVIEGRDFVDNDDDPSPVGDNPDESHATFIAGIIAAKVNDFGMSGVAPDARILNVRACSDGSCMALDAVNAIYYAVDQGADIINLSFGGPYPRASSDHPLESAIEYARTKGVLVVTAAGNDPPESIGGDMMMVPAELPHPNNLAVAATDRRDQIAFGTYYGQGIDIAAPGVDIWSSTITGYAFGDGTSFAAPHVAGVAALLKSTDRSMGYQELAARIKTWVDRPSGVSGRVESGRVSAGDVLFNRFIDTVGNIFEADANWAADLGVTKGCNPPENTLFCPDESVTRGQMAAFLTRHLGLPSASRDHFDDDDSSTFQRDINSLAEAGITKGCNPPSNDRFCPDDPVTRDQMAAFLVRALGLSEDTHPGFDDVPANSTFARDIEKLASAGITRGCNPPQNTAYCPADEVTRGQMTAFLHRTES